MVDGAARFTSFGELLRYLRRRQQLTQIDLAIATGYSTGQISRLEQSQRAPNPDTVHALFVPALRLEHEPQLAARLLELAHATQLKRNEQAQPMDDAPAEQPIGTGMLLVRTKLYVPRPRPGLVARPRLLQQLDAARAVPLTLIAAPAGWGKTTLLAAWLQSGSGSHATVAWLSLDEGDNDPLTLLRYLIAAMQTVEASVGTTALALMQAPQPAGPEQVVRLLLNDVAVLAHDLVLVLEDYHRLTAPTVHELVSWLLDHAPSTLHLILTTRADPPLPLARLRARGQLREIRAAELRFTPTEATQFLRETMGLALSDGDIAALETRTEGWIAGLQLAALAMGERGDVGGFIVAFAGSNRFVVDYLVSEVFTRQAPHLQAFLLQTSILDRLCGPLCDAVLGVEHETTHAQAAYTQNVLEELERANLFVVPLDDERRWYRYHQLFGEVLRAQLQRGVEHPVLAELHRRAGHWYERHELLDAALDHALAAGDDQQAALIIERRAAAFFDHGSVEALEQLLKRLPRRLVESRPKLLLIGAIIANIRGAPAQALDYVAQAEARTLQPESAEAPSGEPTTWLDAFAPTAALTRAASARMVGDMRSSLQQAQQVLTGLHERWPGLRAWGQFEVGIAQAYLNELDAARATFTQLLEQADPARYSSLFLYATFDLGRITILQGRLREVVRVYEYALERIARGGIPANEVSALLQIGLAAVAYEWNDLPRAATLAQSGIELVTDPPRTMYLGPGYSILARTRQAQGDAAGAQSALQRVTALLPGFAVPYLGDLLLMFGFTQAWLGQHEGATLRTWAGLPPLEAGQQGWSEFQQLAHARLLLAEQQHQQAVTLLEPLLQVDDAGRAGVAIEALALYACAQDQRGNRAAALSALERALHLAEREGYVRTFVDGGAAMHSLLRAFRASGPLQAYAGRLLAAFDASATGTMAQPAVAAPGSRLQLEPLSAREREVVRLMADGLDNREIAARLVVGVSTVKKHINSIFGKLGVHSRTEALVRARELDLA